LQPPDDDGIVVVVMEKPDTADKTALDAELIEALDDLVVTARFHGERIREGLARTDTMLRENRRPYPDWSVEMTQRFDGIERRLADIRADIADMRTQIVDVRTEIADMRGQMPAFATKIELEDLSDNIKRVGDGYVTVNHKLDKVADLLKRVILP